MGVSTEAKPKECKPGGCRDRGDYVQYQTVGISAFTSQEPETVMSWRESRREKVPKLRDPACSDMALGPDPRI